jgi:putative Holliday junction resolvase
MPNPSELISLDLGHKRTGMARASTAAELAEPLKTVPTSQVIKTLNNLIEDRLVDAIVVGLPRNLQGGDTAQTTWVRQWVDEAKQEISLPFYWQDEALTSHIAKTRQGLRGRLAQDVDAVAAAFILQDFLNTPEAGRTLA